MTSTTTNPHYSCSKPSRQSIPKPKLQLYQLAKPYKIDDYSGHRFCSVSSLSFQHC